MTPQQDYQLRITAADGQLRAFVATSRNTVNQAAQIHQTSPVMSAALGRLMTATVMMGTMLKDDKDMITASIRADGPAGGLIATADRHGHVKGYVGNPQADMPKRPDGKLNVGGIIGQGRLTVSKDMGAGEPYNSTVALRSGEIAEDFTYYFAQSEQVPSAVALGVLVDVDYSIRQAGGLIIQLLPKASEATISYLEDQLQGLGALTDLLEAGQTPEDIADRLFSQVGYQILDKTPLSWVCQCSRAKTEKALISLGPKDLKEILLEDGQADVKCHFCTESYHFSAEDLQALIQRLEVPSE
ncbi:Hsp33 family molecular chaperone HslO [Peptococcus simiae]|uniref:Hsp33 family molecular chaperone HslO n=1 Tax=Peptococcus simiae TaxID=1643805 RepID=UPI00397F1BA8